MSLSRKSSQINETKSIVPSKATTLNPNAAEFIPFALRASPLPSGSTSNAPDAAARFASSGTIGKAVLDRSESSASNKSDEEAQQYWRHQLPDDITPDFKVMGDEESQVLGGLSLAGLSLHDSAELSRFPASTASGYVLTEQQQQPSPCHINGGSLGEKMRYAATSYGEDPASANFLNFPTKPWDKQVVNTNRLLANGGEVHPHPGNSRQGLMNDMLGDPVVLDGMGRNPMEFLGLQFPGFAAESLAEVYVANGCDLNHTIEMLTQLELQVDGSFNQNTNSKAFSAPNLSALDFPALTVPDSHNGASKFAGNETGNSYRSPDKDNMLLFKSSSSFVSRDAVDLASAVRKLASEDSGLWNYERNGSTDFTVGSSRNSHVLAGAYNSGHGRGIYADRLQSHSSARTSPVWLETGDAVANMYSELREEARDHARLRNTYFEQAQQAFLIGNKTLSKELSLKGQLHNMHMKAMHGKAQEAVYHQRNPVGLEIQGNGRGNEQMIDLHGLHVSEAIHALKHELSVLRSIARAAEQRLQVYICVGTGHHTRGSRTPARLPIAVQRYLLEEEGLDYTEPQPGLLRVVIY